MSSPPTCPACGAKFQHDQILALCKACGLPDEVAVQAPGAVRRWYQRHRAVRGGSMTRKRLQHGRRQGKRRAVTR